LVPSSRFKNPKKKARHPRMEFILGGVWVVVSLSSVLPASRVDTGGRMEREVVSTVLL